ncbi:sodium/hydrogen exchanger family-like protein [Aureococcus anophagefferens]|nr:sodium/hydrogen exchanger family-like protein [Aureococcus anophagefferens]
MLRCFGFALSVWTSGKLAAGLGIPSLVGEIICGIIIGPHVLEIINHTYDPTASVLILVGEVGLCMHAIEAGLMFDPEMMEVVGPRGLAVGIAGSGLPLALSYAIARGWGASADEAFVVGASMATMSAGITLNVLRTGGVLNQPIGQLRCVEPRLRRPDEPFGSWFWYALPVVTNFVTVGVIGAAGVYVVPHVIEARVTPMIPEEYRQNFLLGLLFVKRVYAFLMKIFFAATVGFHVPLAELFQTGTLAKAALLLPVILAKLAMGFFAKPQHAALDIAEAILDTAGADGEAAPAYYCIQTLSKARWDQQTAILSTVTSSDCDIVDVRSWHPKDHVGAAHVVTELYVRTRRCASRTGEVRIQRWLPGARQNDEGELSPTASAQELLRETRDARAFTAPVTADEDVEADARASRVAPGAARVHAADAPPPGGGGGDAAAPPAAPLRQRTHKRQRAKSMIASLESTSCYRDPRDYHELDGFIHTDAHVAFEEQLAPYHQRRAAGAAGALVKQSSSPSALGAAAAAAAPPPPGLAAADGGFETAAAPYSRLSSIESDGGSARRSSFSSEQGCVLPTRLRRRSSSGKNVELQDRA